MHRSICPVYPILIITFYPNKFHAAINPENLAGMTVEISAGINSEIPLETSSEILAGATLGISLEILFEIHPGGSYR